MIKSVNVKLAVHVARVWEFRNENRNLRRDCLGKGGGEVPSRSPELRFESNIK